MTRGEMEDEVLADVSAEARDPASGDLIALRRAVWQAVDEVSERTDCLHKGRLLSLVANQARYCPEGLRRVTAIAWKDSSGVWHGNIPATTQHKMDINFPNWRSEPAQDNARSLVVTGPSSISIYPTPSVSRAGSLRIEGFYKPGQVWEYDADTGAALPAARADVCPLPDFALTAAKERAKYLFAMRLRRKDPSLGSYIVTQNAVSLSAIGRVESDTANHWQAMGGVPRGLWR